MAEEINWGDAVVSNFVNFEDGDNKTIVIKDWKLYMTDKFGDTKPAIKMRVIEENGVAIDNELYCWDTTSQPVMRALKPILENRDESQPVKLQVFRTGDRNDTRYKIKEIKNEE
jgi:hypothetical protein